jgi:hypothetical protein
VYEKYTATSFLSIESNRKIHSLGREEP